MKEIKAIIRPSRLGKVRDVFRILPGFPGMTISNVEGCSANDLNNQRGSLIEELTDFTKKVRIEIVASDEMTPAILNIIRLHAHTGQIGDGVLWVTDVSEFVRLCQAEQT